MSESKAVEGNAKLEGVAGGKTREEEHKQNDNLTVKLLKIFAEAKSDPLFGLNPTDKEDLEDKMIQEAEYLIEKGIILNYYIEDEKFYIVLERKKPVWGNVNGIRKLIWTKHKALPLSKKGFIKLLEMGGHI
jgi:hypothetical protein